MADRKNTVLNYLLNIFIIILVALCIYLSFSFISKNFFHKEYISKDTISAVENPVTNQPNLTIQIDVRNGSGDNGIAIVFMDYLRKKGFDVVDAGNYSSSDINRTLILYRNENKKTAAQKVAQILGANEKYIIPQINSSLYLDVTVVIGRDYSELKPYTDKSN